MESVFTIISTGLIITAIADPCNPSVYKTIPNIGFRFINYRLEATDVLHHDYQLASGWYYVGNETMPEQPPDDIFTCGTKFPVWLNGTHPTGDSPVTMTACQLDLTEDCKVTYSIKIKRCSGFFVYFLEKTLSTNVGYCFDLIFVRSITPKVSGEGVKGKGPKYVPPKPRVLVSTDVKKVRGNRNITSAYFTCDFNESKNESLLYIVSWYKENDALYMTDYYKSANDIRLRLTEDIFKKHGFSMGSKISCSIRAFYKKNSTPSKASAMADGFFVGIKILTPSLTFTSNETDRDRRSIRLQPTVPIGCKGSICDVRLVAYVPDNSIHGTCTGLAFDQGTCGVKLESNSYSDIRKIPVKISDNGKYFHGGSYEVFLRTESTIENAIWGNYALPPIKVSINDASVGKLYEGKKCHSVNDPHMTTFDGRKYDCHQEGEYILYLNTKYNTEVQAKYYTCGHTSNKPIKCNCGVAVRAGLDLFEVSVCGGKTFVGYKYCDEKTITVKSDGMWKYKIFFEYGTYVETSIDSSNPTRINTHIIPSSHDVGVVFGLCGDINDDFHDDFQYRPGEGVGKPNLNSGTIKNFVKNWKWELQNQPTEFLEVWRVRSAAENMFSPNFDESRLIPWSFKACVCTNATVSDAIGSSKISNSIPCTSNGVATCSKGKILGTHTCSVYKSRRKRSIERNPIIPIVHIDIKKIRKRAVSNINMTEDDARKYCHEQIGASTVFTLCSNVPSVKPNTSLDTCVADIMLTGSTEWTAGTKESMQDSCLTELNRNTTLRESNENKTSIADQIEEIACQNNCSSNGICAKGRCKCDKGFGGSDCSTDMLKGPSISGLLDHGMCDEKDIQCDHAYVFGSFFADTENLTCRLEEFTMSDGGKKEIEKTHYVSAEFETLVEAICPLKTTRRRRSVSGGMDSFVFGFTISVSNDGKAFETGKDLFIYDSTCQEIRNVSNEIRFTLKTGFCFIDDSCVTDTELNLKDKCLICNPSIKPRSWTTVDTEECAKLHPDLVSKVSTTDGGSKNYLWVIGVVAGVVIGVAVGVVVVIKLTKKRGKRVSDSTLFERDTHENEQNSAK